MKYAERDPPGGWRAGSQFAGGDAGANYSTMKAEYSPVPLAVGRRRGCALDGGPRATVAAAARRARLEHGGGGRYNRRAPHRARAVQPGANVGGGRDAAPRQHGHRPSGLHRRRARPRSRRLRFGMRPVTVVGRCTPSPAYGRTERGHGRPQLVLPPSLSLPLSLAFCFIISCRIVLLFLGRRAK